MNKRTNSRKGKTEYVRRFRPTVFAAGIILAIAGIAGLAGGSFLQEELRVGTLFCAVIALTVSVVCFSGTWEYVALAAVQQKSRTTKTKQTSNKGKGKKNAKRKR